MKWRNIKPILILLILFGTFHLFFDAIYENHLGEGTDSDILYPYLFSQDFWTGEWKAVLGWNLPPCSNLFPEILLSILIYPFVNSVYWFHWAFGFFYFVMPYVFARALDVPNKISYLFSLGFLALAGVLPNSLGQFYFPGFHAVVFIFAAYTIYEINHWDSKNKVQTFRFLIILSFIWISEYWFFIHIAPFLLAYVLVRLQKKSIYPIGLVLIGFGLGKVWQQGLRFSGIGIFTSKELPTMDRIQAAKVLILKDPSSWVSGLMESITKHPIFAEWFDLYFVLITIYILISLFRIKRKELFLELVLFLSPILTVVALFIFQIEPNFRYLYFLVFCIFFLIYRITGFIPIFRSVAVFFVFLGIVYFYNDRYPTLNQNIKQGETKRIHRMNCLSQFDPQVPGASTYWPIKYSYAFSNKDWTLVPFTKEGIYYPWVSNRTWDKGLGQKSFREFSWGITETKEHLDLWKGVRLVEECEGWFFYRR
ncbi:hypothetical protein [Leptospira harrisiae]|uniref:Glycosyltransferase RgtA/B/C/D-like domain-containing protein n=1 Tax=Leptospira harrisiae TaxID=2023189 RepID=A0A2N0AJR7_9LEPT|nr:hypothetical protein [Leptospira harrisiae]PJZ84546.1 hypothetical protein CH364_11065 [Leptospira harrisiae]PKA07286.1 hypothetical protein CH366_12765 [Leptospira harrisiae]